MFPINKSILAALAILLLTIGAYAQPSGHIEERFELTSIVFRLTGDEAFVHSNPDQYITDIDNYFSKYKDHELIEFVKKTMYSKSILSLSLSTSFAGDIKITPKGIVWTDEWTLTFEHYDTLPDDQIWTKAERNEYLRLLNKFYKETHFKQFYASHLPFYQRIEESFKDISTQIDTAWFSDFFGMPFELDNIWIVPVNGDFNFSDRRIDHNGNAHHNCAISGIFIDTLGTPFFGENILGVLIHEICHNYNNPICHRHQTEFQSLCDTLYTFVRRPLIREYYGSPSAILDEGFNKLCEFAYYKSKNLYCDSLIRDMCLMNTYRGFFWFEDMYRYLDVFFQNRETFKTFEDFLPALKLFLERTVELMEHYYCPKYDLIRPRVVATYPGYNAVVDTNLRSIVFQFSKPMGEVISFWTVDDKNISPIPRKGRSCHWDNEYTYVVTWEENLKPNTKYGFRITEFFSDKIDYFGCFPYDLIFETK